ncbi:hypothetical protein PACTADRAFT_47772 [Pachysolen tannophilus NRRL Y-2460]|uniref:ATP-dependent RNA helicase n=1 Tax=Pachysolen tannophilus NRRL Y-2460 TaxID=669874 RepID=A0A1E4U1Q8_PACTA|nr:hypothetical protein PACTADRAFT_47772 [Pachysolen tannophilus NRRL Y-2460]
MQRISRVLVLASTRNSLNSKIILNQVRLFSSDQIKLEGYDYTKRGGSKSYKSNSYDRFSSGRGGFKNDNKRNFRNNNNNNDKRYNNRFNQRSNYLAEEEEPLKERTFPPLKELDESLKVIKTSKVEDSLLDEDIKKAFKRHVGETFTPCQEQSINYFVNNERGIIVRAKTGTGKTFAFGLPIFQGLKEMSKNAKKLTSVDSVIFAPTRDLAVQTKNSLEKVWMDSKTSIRNNKIVLVTGKIPIRAQLQAFQGHEKPPIVVATPGRFIDLIENEPAFTNAMKNVQNVVIDEADELLSQNFKSDLESIFGTLKKLSENESDVKFKTFLFSATMSNNVYELADNVIGEGYEFIDANKGESTEVNKNIKQSLVVTNSIFESYASALQFIKSKVENPDFKPIIFLPNTYSVDFFHDLLFKYLKQQENVPSYMLPQVLKIHGKLTQGERNRAQRGFRGEMQTDRYDRYSRGKKQQPQKARSSILVASNVVSRGMDFPNVTHVIQIGVNPDLSNYTHRVGRTGRAGKEGHSLLISTDFEMPFVKKLIEHGNEFQEELTYEKNEEQEQIIKECAKGMNFEEIASVNLGVYTNLPSRYGAIKKRDYIKGCSDLYRDLQVDPEEHDKPFLSRSVAQRLGMNDSYSSKYFNIGRRTSGYQQDDYDQGFSSNNNDNYGKNRFSSNNNSYESKYSSDSRGYNSSRNSSSRNDSSRNKY